MNPVDTTGILNNYPSYKFVTSAMWLDGPAAIGGTFRARVVPPAVDVEALRAARKELQSYGVKPFKITPIRAKYIVEPSIKFRDLPKPSGLIIKPHRFTS
jgi:hypothetical protein